MWFWEDLILFDRVNSEIDFLKVWIWFILFLYSLFMSVLILCCIVWEYQKSIENQIGRGDHWEEKTEGGGGWRGRDGTNSPLILDTSRLPVRLHGPTNKFVNNAHITLPKWRHCTQCSATTQRQVSSLYSNKQHAPL